MNIEGVQTSQNALSVYQRVRSVPLYFNFGVFHIDLCALIICIRKASLMDIPWFKFPLERIFIVSCIAIIEDGFENSSILLLKILKSAPTLSVKSLPTHLCH